ncbi:MAG: imidazolonepropionase [Anaerolineae bacterium]
MSQPVDLIIHNAGQVCTLPAQEGGPQRGSSLGTLGLITDGAVAIRDGLIVEVGTTAAIRAHFSAQATIDAAGRAVVPGFVDPHTHLIYAGDRAAEFEMRIAGVSYMDIMAAGGGINSTVRATRAAGLEELIAGAHRRLDAMLALGTTTAEVKTGYGLNLETEIRMLEAIAALDRMHPIDLVPTFLPAHAVPPEYAGRPDEYVDLVVSQMIPAAAAWYRSSHFATQGTPFFIDVFCEAGVFDLEQTRRVLEAGIAHGMAVKAHVDEFETLGGVGLGVALGAVSLDHLDVTPAEDRAQLAASGAVGVVLPAVTFNLGSAHFADARALVDAGAALAIATDINPGSAPCPSMPLVMAIACRYQRLTPAEALAAATINAAHAIGLGGRIGSLEPGRQADLLLLDEPDYRHLAYQFGGNIVHSVIKRGQIVHGG